MLGAHNRLTENSNDMDARSRLSGYLAGLAFFLSLLPVTATGVTGQDLFEAEVPVSSQTPVVRTTAMQQALAEVLVRVTGQRELLQQPSGRALLGNAGNYVQQYRYFTVPGTEPPQLKMRVRFDGEAQPFGQCRQRRHAGEQRQPVEAAGAHSACASWRRSLWMKYRLRL